MSCIPGIRDPQSFDRFLRGVDRVFSHRCTPQCQQLDLDLSDHHATRKPSVARLSRSLSLRTNLRSLDRRPPRTGRRLNDNAGAKSDYLHKSALCFE